MEQNRNDIMNQYQDSQMYQQAQMTNETVMNYFPVCFQELFSNEMRSVPSIQHRFGIHRSIRLNVLQSKQIQHISIITLA